MHQNYSVKRHHLEILYFSPLNFFHLYFTFVIVVSIAMYFCLSVFETKLKSFGLITTSYIWSDTLVTNGLSWFKISVIQGANNSQSGSHTSHSHLFQVVLPDSFVTIRNWEKDSMVYLQNLKKDQFPLIL